MTASTSSCVRVRTVVHGGEGLGAAVPAEDDARPWFIEGGLPGELLEIEPTRETTRWRRGRIAKVLEPSSFRVAAPCALAMECGGCAWQHVRPEAQAELKGAIVRGQLRGLLEPDAAVPVVSGPALGYRRRAKMHYRRQGDAFVLGFRRAHAHELIDVRHCPVLEPVLDRAMQMIRDLAPVLPEQGNVLGLSNGTEAALGLPGVRWDDGFERVAQGLLGARLAGIAVRGGRQRRNLGKTVLSLDGGEGWAPLSVSPFSFCQANGALASQLAQHVVASSEATGRRVLELHAGVGNFTRGLARTAQRVWAVESDRDSIGLLLHLAQETGLPINAKHGQAESLLERLATREVSYDVVVVDPPRSGLGQRASRALAKVAADRIVYVSCDPATLARDLRELCAAGGRLADVKVFDMMPMTPQIEVVATVHMNGQGGRHGARA